MPLRPHRCLYVLATLLLLLPLAPPAEAAAPAELLSVGRPALSSSGLDAGKANDTDPRSYWQSYLRGDHHAWWQVDLQGTFHVSRLLNRNYVDGVRYYHYYVRTSLDGRTWSAPIVRKSDNAPAADAGESHDIDAVARYVRVDVTANSANMYAHITDFKVWGERVEAAPPPRVSVDVGEVYRPGDTVRTSVGLRDDRASTVKAVRVVVSGLNDPYTRDERTVATDVRLRPGHDVRVRGTVPAAGKPGAYGVFVHLDMADGGQYEGYQTFFRVAAPNELQTYRISRTGYRGFPIYDLDGGMSAEYTVEKSAEALHRTVTPTYRLSKPGYGPNPVWATPHFLSRAVSRTVDFYDRTLGPGRRLDTVFISPGVETMPYMSQTMNAPVLPSHFLVSSGTIQELKTVLDTANAEGLPSYATFGPTGSMSNGVAWIKMLGLPAEYRSFLRRHHVRNVIFLGTKGLTGGSNAAKKILLDGTTPEGTHPGDLFGIYGTDWQWDNRFYDLPDFTLEPHRRDIPDWEDGMGQEQVDGIADGLGKGTRIAQVSSQDSGIAMWNLAPYVQLAFIKKNQRVLAPAGPAVREVNLNPYLISHPFYESTRRGIPFLYWEGFSAEDTIGKRLNQNLRKALATYYPEIDFGKLTFNLNTARNFGAEINAPYTEQMRKLGLTDIRIANPDVDEVWDPADGMNSISELAAKSLADSGPHRRWTAWAQRLNPLTIDDLKKIAALDDEITVTER